MATLEEIVQASSEAICEPTDANYRRVHQLLCTSPFYSPSTEAVDRMLLHIKNQNTREVINTFEESKNSLLLHPHANLYYSFALSQAGKAEISAVFMTAAKGICKGIQATGNGSRTRPYLVTHESCGKSFAEYHLGKKPISQVVKTVDGRSLCSVTCEDGSIVHFDVSAQYAHPDFKGAENVLVAKDLVDRESEEYGTVMAPMKEFLPAPTLENYMTVFKGLIASSFYKPGASYLEQMDKALDANQHERVVELYKEANPNYILNPQACVVYAAALKNLGEEKTARVFIMSAVSICKGIEATGNGTEAKPWLVTHESCCNEFVQFHLEKDPAKSAIYKAGDKFLYTVTATDGSTYEFDITIPRKHAEGVSAGDLIASLPSPAAKKSAPLQAPATASGVDPDRQAEIEAAAQSGMTMGCVGSLAVFSVACFVIGSDKFIEIAGGRGQLISLIAVILFCIIAPYAMARRAARRVANNGK
jgi:hypothetical protein